MIADDAPTPWPTGADNQNPEGVSFWALVAEDLKVHDGDLFSQGFWALFNHRFGNWRMSVRSRVLRAPLTAAYLAWKKLVEMTTGIHLPYITKVGRRLKLEHFGGMILVARSIGHDVIIRQNTTFGLRKTDEVVGSPIIGDGVDIGAGAVILGHVRIGEGAVIGANAVVIEDVPAGATVVGVPARVVKVRPPA